MVNYRAFARRRGQMKAASTKVRSRDPKHTVRATRTAGRQMRSRLLDAASRHFKESGLAAVSIAAILAARDALPSAMTHYFPTNGALFGGAARRDGLRRATPA